MVEKRKDEDICNIDTIKEITSDILKELPTTKKNKLFITKTVG